MSPCESLADDLVRERNVARARYAFQGVGLGAVEADFSFVANFGFLGYALKRGVQDVFWEEVGGWR